jgi:hypothetical protein
MSCKECRKKNDLYFKELGEATKNPYGKIIENGTEKYIPIKDYQKGLEQGFFSKETEFKVL